MLPLFLKVEGRRLVVVGGGDVGERKAASLLDAGAAVTVVAPDATPALRALAAEGRLAWTARPFAERDVEGAWLVYAATSDPATQSAVSRACETARIFCVAVDDPSHATAYSASVVRRPPFTVAISSGGATPALTRLVREVIEHVLPAEGWVERAQALRAQWLAQRTPMADRFAELVREIAQASPPDPPT
jgi:siroheme synthase-like protein